MPPPPLTVPDILRRADAHRRRHRRWPTAYSGPITGTGGDTWRRVDSALRLGLRGLPGGSSLARLLQAERGARKRSYLAPLTERQVLAWADRFRREAGRWPTTEDGPVPDSGGETWRRVDSDLRLGLRGLPPGSSLARLLARRRGYRNHQALPRLTVRQILVWADYHRLQTGEWPTARSGPIPHSKGETWAAVQAALQIGRRGLPGGTTLPKLLEGRRGRRHHQCPPPLSVERVLKWAEAHRRRTGELPRASSGPIAGAEGETWNTVDAALREGRRGLPGGQTLHRLLWERLGGRGRRPARRRGVPAKV